MRKKKTKHPSIREDPAFKELIKDLRKQVPDDQKNLQEVLDEIIAPATDNKHN